MRMTINLQSSTPLYHQVCEQVKHAVASGRLRPGHQLPTVRELATALRINPNTVAKAYRELAHEGVVDTRHGSGVYVSDKPPTIHKAERIRILKAFLDHAIVEALHFDFLSSEVKKIFHERVQVLYTHDHRTSQEKGREEGRT